MRAISLALLLVGCGGATDAPVPFDGASSVGTGGSTAADSSAPPQSATGGQQSATGASVVSTGGATEAQATGGASTAKATFPGGSSGATTSTVATGGRAATVVTSSATGGKATGGKATGGTFATGGAPMATGGSATGGAPMATGGSATGGASFLPQGIAGAVGYACPPEVAKVDPPVATAYIETKRGTKLCEWDGLLSGEPINTYLHPTVYVSDIEDPRTVLTLSDRWCTRQVFVLIDQSKKWCVETGPEARTVGLFEPIAIAKEITGLFWHISDAHTPGADGKCPFTCADFGL